MEDYTTWEKINIHTFAKETKEYNTNEPIGRETELFKKAFKDNTRILDLGCGCGRTTRILAKMFPNSKIDAGDINRNMIQTAIKKPIKNVRYTYIDATKIHEKDETYDHILFSYNGLDYIVPNKKRKQALKEIYRTLKKEGTIILSMHNLPNLSIWTLRTIIKTISYQTPKGYLVEPHKKGIQIVKYTKKSKQKQLLESIGFKIDEIDESDKRWTNYILKK